MTELLYCAASAGLTCRKIQYEMATPDGSRVIGKVGKAWFVTGMSGPHGPHRRLARRGVQVADDLPGDRDGVIQIGADDRHLRREGAGNAQAVGHVLHPLWLARSDTGSRLTVIHDSIWLKEYPYGCPRPLLW
jgi:hypothetical protein